MYRTFGGIKNYQLASYGFAPLIFWTLPRTFSLPCSGTHWQHRSHHTERSLIAAQNVTVSYNDISRGKISETKIHS